MKIQDEFLIFFYMPCPIASHCVVTINRIRGWGYSHLAESRMEDDPTKMTITMLLNYSLPSTMAFKEELPVVQKMKRSA